MAGSSLSILEMKCLLIHNDKKYVVKGFATSEYFIHCTNEGKWFKHTADDMEQYFPTCVSNEYGFGKSNDIAISFVYKALQSDLSFIPTRKITFPREQLSRTNNIELKVMP